MFKAVFKHSVNDDKPQWSKVNRVQFSEAISSILHIPFINRQQEPVAFLICKRNITWFCAWYRIRDLRILTFSESCLTYSFSLDAVSKKSIASKWIYSTQTLAEYKWSQSWVRLFRPVIFFTSAFGMNDSKEHCDTLTRGFGKGTNVVFLRSFLFCIK